MDFILIELLKGCLVIFGLYLLSFLLEKLTGLGLLYWMLVQRKNVEMAHGFANLAAVVFFIIQLIVLHLDIEGLPVLPEGYSFSKWLISVFVLTAIFRMIHFKLTPIDPNRDNYDFSD